MHGPSLKEEHHCMHSTAQHAQHAQHSMTGTWVMVALALVRDMALPAPWEQEFQAWGSPLP